MTQTDWQPQVNQALQPLLLQGVDLFFGWPTKWTSGKIQMAYRQANAAPSKYADDEPYQEHVEIYLDTFGASAAAVSTAAKQAQALLHHIGFELTFSQDLMDPSHRHHRTERYSKYE